MRSKLTWAVVAEVLILAVCLVVRPDFFKISYQPSTGMLYGNLIDIINRSSEITIIAMGMTMVIALGGTDISVGALVAVAGAFALKFLRWDVTLYPTPGDYTVYPFILVIVVPLIICTLMGLFNGVLIGKFKLQPIIATLRMMKVSAMGRRKKIVQSLRESCSARSRFFSAIGPRMTPRTSGAPGKPNFFMK